MVFECDAYDAVREHFWYLFEEFGEWESPRDTVRPGGRCLAEFMQQRQSSIAAFIYCFLARRDPEQARLMLTGADSSTSGGESELSELVEVSS
jgi:hypothetical protein